MTDRSRDRVRTQLTQLAAAKLDVPTLIDEAGRLISHAVPFDGACWHTMDPATLIETSLRTVNLPPHEDRISKYEYLHEDYNKFSKLARSPRHSRTLSDATGGHLNRSMRYRDFLHPAGIRGELRTSFVVEDTCWGSQVLFRTTDFGPAERDFTEQVAGTLGRGFRTALMQAGSGGAARSCGPGLILLDGDSHVESMTETAYSWLTELGATGDPHRDGLPHALLAVAEHARGTSRDTVARAPGVSGRWVVLHASVGSGGGPGRVAVILQGPTPDSIAPLIAAAYSLTRRERELTDLVLQGYPTRDIATHLFLSPHTVQQHLKSIFTKTGVHSRRELVSNVFMRHYQPRIASLGFQTTT